MSWLIALLGVVLAIAPWLLGYSDESAAMWTSLVIGIVVAVVAAYDAITGDERRWEEWLAVIAGAAAVIAPFIFFSSVTTAVWTSVVIGVLLIVLAGYRALSTPQS